MMLKIAIAGEAEASNDAHDGGWIGAEALGYGADAQQNVFTRVLEDGANDFLTLGAELLDALGKIDGLVVCRCLLHAARELPKSIYMSTVGAQVTEN
jgi:hypothetical protein